MFQNIAGQVEEEAQNMEKDKTLKLKQFWKESFTKQKLCLYILSFLISMVECIGGFSPFAMAMFAACCSNKIPTAIVYVVTLLGTVVRLGTGQALNYLLTSFVFLGFMLLRKPREQEEYANEKLKLGAYVFLSTLLVQVASMLFSGFMVYELLTSLMTAIATYIFYKIITNSLIVIHEFGIKKAFAIEEVMGASIVLTIAASAFGNFRVFGFEIRNILSILIVLVLGWKNGILVGATSGITIGTILGIIGQGNPIMIASFALSGLLAGIFSKLGKVGVIVGFILGNAILTYTTNGNTQTVIYFQEILIASLGLLLVPKDIQINIEELFSKNKFLPTGPTYRIQENKETVFKLNNVSEAISQMADTYKEVAATVVEEETIEEQNQKIFLEELRNYLEGLEDNILYEDLEERENVSILSDIFQVLLASQKITRKELLDIFAKHNSYIIGFDDATTSLQLEEDIKKVIDAINEAYRISKVNFIWQQKMEENKRNISNQLDGVSKVISSLATDIEEHTQEEEKEKFQKEKEKIIAISEQKGIQIQEIKIAREETGKYLVNIYLDSCEQVDRKECTITTMEKILSKVLGEKIVVQKGQCGWKQHSSLCRNTFVSEDRYLLQLGIAKATKNQSAISGDSSLSTRLNDGKHLLAICDGMGSGPKARQSSQIAIKMLERLLTNGFDKDTSMELINSTLSANSKEDSYSTLDVAILDLYTGNIEFIKNGACPSYMKHNRNVQIIKAVSLPAGILENISLVVYDKDIENNDILVMCSDGIMESNSEYQNKELWVHDILKTIETDNVQRIADIIKKEAIDNGFGITKDDMTVMVAKFMKK